MTEYSSDQSISQDALAAAVGQLLVVGFQGSDTTPPAAIQQALGSGKIGGVILFRRNVQDVEQVCALNQALHDAAKTAIDPPFIAVDQEGGRVVRVRDPLTPIPPMRTLGETHDYDWIASVSEVIATEIGALGFNLNFAPVLDVDTNPDNPVIGDRAFSESPDIVARAAGSFLVGHLMSGVIPCGKHFPGHGDTLVDSHLGLPVVTHDMARLKSIELVPFERLCKVDIPMLMTAHIMLPELDPDYPATLSPAIMTDLLRKQMGYDGVVITDDLEMKAVLDHYDIEEMVELGLRAGIDIFLICHTHQYWARAFDHLMKLGMENKSDRERIFESAQRVRKLKQSSLGHFPRPWTPHASWQEVLGNPEHLEILQKYDRLAHTAIELDPTEKTKNA